MAAQIGRKVFVEGSEQDGIAEVISYPDSQDTVEVAFYVSPVRTVTRRVPVERLTRAEVPGQTRCYYKDGAGFLVGRILACVPSHVGNSYHVSFPQNRVVLLAEDEFHVRSHLRAGDPVATLASLAHQTPFLFQRRSQWLQRYTRQVWLSRGLRGLISSKIEFFPHQVEVARRVLQDPVIRYLLADEVGLGKTIEAGVILRQLHLDAPHLPIVALVPGLLVQQWQDELASRFDLQDVEVRRHEDMPAYENRLSGIMIIDEAHRVVNRDLYEITCRITEPSKTPHLLLLSATPLLHHERELLALLHLLDPDTYRLDQLEEFRSRLEKRQDLGRTLLALSRSTRPAFTLRHVRHCAELLPGDAIVGRIAKSCEDAVGREDEREVLVHQAASLNIHLTETYRIHRRLLRTRRAMVIEEGDIHQLRSEAPPAYQFQGSKAGLAAELWRTLDEWRIRAAAHVVDSTPEKRHELTRTYIQFAEAVASDRRHLIVLLAERKKALTVPGEADPVERMLSLARRIGDVDRSEALLRHLEKLEQGRLVAFCSQASSCLELDRFLAERWSGQSFILSGGGEAWVTARTIADFRTSRRSVLLADRVAEEGLNLQFADGGVLLDLPFEPMRLEQRLGRLDRIGRRKPIRCTPILSIPDPSLAFDAAWYEVLTKGLGLLSGSLADLQFLVDREVTRLTEIVFDGGPAALLAQVSDLATVVDREREAMAEQDVLDGLYLGGLRDSALWQSIESADEEEDEFGNALQLYIKDIIGLRVSNEAVPGKGRLLSFGLRKSPPLVPVALLHGIGDYAGQPGTFNRTLATQNLDLQFFRPGHPLVENLHGLAQWDERGQAFALWRHVPGITQPTFVFRLGLRTVAEIEVVRQHLDSLGWDEVARGSLVRLIDTWHPQQFHEVYLDADGVPAERRMVEVCMPSFVSGRDLNLGGRRAHVLVDLTGERAWKEQCEQVGNHARAQVLTDPAFMATIAEARRAASEYFEVVIARLHQRSRRHGEDTKAVARMIEEQSLLRQLVDSILAKPSVQIDSIGVYVLSEKPVCQM